MGIEPSVFQASLTKEASLLTHFQQKSNLKTRVSMYKEIESEENIGNEVRKAYCGRSSANKCGADAEAAVDIQGGMRGYLETKLKNLFELCDTKSDRQLDYRKIASFANRFRLLTYL